MSFSHTVFQIIHFCAKTHGIFQLRDLLRLIQNELVSIVLFQSY